ncbi:MULTISPECIES: VOC family protein [unclassified Modicisalibacter]|uniref:2-oxoadipate dioxygenase/decarboxylase HglS n=1 Tax=unclassified Modicisalibacter TaxID=2679913 RepID=UPI001CCE5B9D|nr:MULTISPECIES: VOC family protein [unclassified Modicisalibacter]MBZ9557936.1 VOC family protein [Modicisalibacter sp. R2A 31.J]MBZ9573396.1 VOC family protein [Modicisalibacter sp. MOD 31.J]
MTQPHLPSDEIRDRFSKAMSAMYQSEVPQYATLLELVEQVNRETLERDSALAERLAAHDELHRLGVERHGAIRVGSADELAMLRRLFAVMGMYPVGYYDLSEAGVPVHATAFRPVDDAALARNPFRLFTSLLRLELIDDPALRERAAAILEERDIFTPGVRELIARHEQQGGLDEAQAERFVAEALETFRWHKDATVDLDTYQALHEEHRLIADVVCFRGPHINHLTPRTLDIDEVQRRMPQAGMNPKAVIEGPPRRTCPILLRQTSFKALEETIRFAGERQGSHTARFGEIEQRGMALTAEGRALYDRLLGESRQRTAGLDDNAAHQRELAEVFAAFPDDEAELRRRELAFFEYRPTQAGRDAAPVDTDDREALLERGLITARPITYEDFLPVSAAGIFRSNLGDGTHEGYTGNANREAFEAALGAPVTDELALYAEREKTSWRATRDALGR